MASRVCNQCGEEKRISEYHRHRRRQGGRELVCKRCKNLQSRRYRLGHREQIAEHFAEWYAKNKDRHAATCKRWREANPEKARESKRRYKRRKRAAAAGVENALTKREWAIVLEQFEGRCAYCGGEGLMTMDHVIPLAQGGPHTMENVVPACGTCNDHKGARTPEQAGMG